MSFCVAGRADDPGYAEAERLCDELYAFVECTVVKFRKSPSEWPAFASQLAEVLGYVGEAAFAAHQFVMQAVPAPYCAENTAI